MPMTRFAWGVALLVALNLVDAVSTHLALRLGIAEEANPLMRWAWNISPSTFWVLKFMLVVLALSVIGRWATEKVGTQVLLVINGFYAIVLLIHGVGWFHYLS